MMKKGRIAVIIVCVMFMGLGQAFGETLEGPIKIIKLGIEKTADAMGYFITDRNDDIEQCTMFKFYYNDEYGFGKLAYTMLLSAKIADKSLSRVDYQIVDGHCVLKLVEID